jgi:hypothetical protein
LSFPKGICVSLLLLLLSLALALVLAFFVCHSRRESALAFALALAFLFVIPAGNLRSARSTTNSKGHGFSRAITTTNVSGL